MQVLSKYFWSPLSSVRTECERAQEGMEGWSPKGLMHIMWLVTEIKGPECKSALLKVCTSSCVSQTFYFNIPQLCICLWSGAPQSWDSWAGWDLPHLQPRNLHSGLISPRDPCWGLSWCSWKVESRVEWKPYFSFKIWQGQMPSVQQLVQ